jgi:hypothetical protein
MLLTMEGLSRGAGVVVEAAVFLLKGFDDGRSADMARDQIYAMSRSCD